MTRLSLFADLGRKDTHQLTLSEFIYVHIIYVFLMYCKTGFLLGFFQGVKPTAVLISFVMLIFVLFCTKILEGPSDLGEGTSPTPSHRRKPARL